MIRGAPISGSDGDGEVDLDEAYRFAADHTLRATSTSVVGPQHPTFRHEFGGRTTFTLTRPGSGDRNARVVLPAGVTWFVFAGSADGTVLAEVQRDDPARTVSVRAARVFLRGRGKDALLEATAEVRAGDRIDAGRLAFTRTSYARLVRKGGGPEAAHALEASYVMQAPIETEGDLQHGVSMGYLHERSELSVSVRLSLVWGGFDNTGPQRSTSDETDGVVGLTLHATTRTTSLSLGLRRAFDLALVSLELGVSAGLAWIHQDFSWAGDAPDRDALAGRFDASVGVVADLSERVFLRLEGAAVLSVLTLATSGNALAARFTPQLQAGLGYRF